MYFSEAFKVAPDILTDENVFDISLVSDLPLFIDPFLIFESDKPAYQRLHNEIVRYLSFVRDQVVSGGMTSSQEKEWLHFPEIPNNWLGFSVGSNKGHGLGTRFARGAALGLGGPVKDFGDEQTSRGSHIERLFLFSEGAGRDALSDFITGLCHGFLLDFTERFSRKHLSSDQCREFNVRHVRFDYENMRWVHARYYLPFFATEYVLLTPIDLLTQSIPWINRPDLFDKFGGMLDSVGDAQLRSSVNTFIQQRLAPPPDHPRDKPYHPPKKDVKAAYERAIEQYPALANWYIAQKEADGSQAIAQSRKRVSRAADFYRDRVIEFLSSILKPSGFFEIDASSHAELMSVFSDAIERGGQELFLGADGALGELTGEDVRLICSLAWRADNNTDRSLPAFRFVSDAKSASQFESADLSKAKSAGTLVLTTDWVRKAHVEFVMHNSKPTLAQAASITGPRERNVSVESVFISYTKSDEKWARWIGGVLASAGYSVTVQYKDFLPGSNFVDKMHKAVEETDRTIAILSEEYLKSSFAAAEWQAAFRDDPLGHHRKLIPLRVSRVGVTGLLGSIVYADLFDLSEELARAVLLGAISAGKRPAATSPEDFPGQSNSTQLEGFLPHVPAEISKNNPSPDASQRLRVAHSIASLSTNQVNLLVFALNPPENEIPPVNAAARDRASALLEWVSREGVDIAVVESLIGDLEK